MDTVHRSDAITPGAQRVQAPPPTPFAASRWTPQRGMARMVRDAARGPWGVQAFRRLGDTMRHGRHHHLTRRVVTKHSTSGSVVRVRPIPKRTSAHTHTHTHMKEARRRKDMEMENEKRRSPRHLRHPHTGRRRDGPCRGACDTWERRRTSVDPQMDTLDLVGSMFLLEPGWARTAWTRIALRRRAAPPRRRTNERVNDFFLL